MHLETGDAAVGLVVAGGVASLTLRRPAKRNALTYEMWRAVATACHTIQSDSTVGVVVLRGEGEHFCAGADIGDVLAERSPDEPSFAQVNEAAERALANLRVPTVALVRGDCVGGGCNLAVACDIRLATHDSRFGITPARLGLVYPPPALERLVALLGPVAKRLLYTGELIDAPEALRIGLVDEVLASQELEVRLASLCRTLGERSLLTQASTKEMVGAILQHGSVPTEMVDRWNDEAALAADPAEGVAAFGERRPPSFTWRSPSAARRSSE